MSYGVNVIVTLSVLILHVYLAVAAVVRLQKSLGISCAYEVGLHVVDAAIRIHLVLLGLAFNLNHAHCDPINHLDRLSIIYTIELVVITYYDFWGHLIRLIRSRLSELV